MRSAIRYLIASRPHSADALWNEGKQVVLALDAGGRLRTGIQRNPVPHVSQFVPLYYDKMPACYHDDNRSTNGDAEPTSTCLIKTSNPYGYAVRAGGVERIHLADKRAHMHQRCMIVTHLASLAYGLLENCVLSSVGLERSWGWDVKSLSRSLSLCYSNILLCLVCCSNTSTWSSCTCHRCGRYFPNSCSSLCNLLVLMKMAALIAIEPNLDRSCV